MTEEILGKYLLTIAQFVCACVCNSLLYFVDYRSNVMEAEVITEYFFNWFQYNVILLANSDNNSQLIRILRDEWQSTQYAQQLSYRWTSHCSTSSSHASQHQVPPRVTKQRVTKPYLHKVRKASSIITRLSENPPSMHNSYLTEKYISFVVKSALASTALMNWILPLRPSSVSPHHKNKPTAVLCYTGSILIIIIIIIVSFI